MSRDIKEILKMLSGQEREDFINDLKTLTLQPDGMGFRLSQTRNPSIYRTEFINNAWVCTKDGASIGTKSSVEESDSFLKNQFFLDVAGERTLADSPPPATPANFKDVEGGYWEKGVPKRVFSGTENNRVVGILNPDGTFTPTE